MSHGYPFASLVAAASCFVDFSLMMPGWLAGIAAAHIACAVLFMGLSKHETG
ncbi:hypothetical protein [Novosphingobium sp. YAF33]|uniref:hypothetical protein n=1 Tax=Novosphingobium sp. YAF33 TaxID=3233082 RepID=UPI003F9BA66B